MLLGSSEVEARILQYLPVLTYPGDQRLAAMVGEGFAREQRVIPVPATDESLVVVSAEPMDKAVLEDLRVVTARRVRAALGTWPEIDLALNLIFRPDNVANALHLHLVELLPKAGVPSARMVSDRSPGADGGESGVPDPLSYVDEITLVEATSLLLYLPWIRLENYNLSQALARLVPASLAQRHSVVPLYGDGQFLFVAGTGLIEREARSELESSTGLNIRQVLCSRAALLGALERMYSQTPSAQAKRTTSLAEALSQGGLVERRQLQTAETVRHETGEPIERVLLRLGYITQDTLLAALAFQLDADLIDLAEIAIPADLAGLLPEALLRRYRCVPFALDGDSLSMAMADPSDTEAIELISYLTGLTVTAYLCRAGDLKRAWGGLCAHGAKPTKTRPRHLLGWYLLLGGYITEHRLSQALAEQRRTHQRIGEVLLALGFVSEETVAEVLALQAAMPWLHLGKLFPAEEAVQSVPEDLARKHCLIPLMKQGRTLVLAVADPSDAEAIAGVQQATGLATKAVLATTSAIKSAQDRHYGVSLSRISPRVRDFTDHLLHQGVLSDQQRWQVWKDHIDKGAPVDEVINDSGLLAEEDVAVALAEYTQMDYMEIAPYARVTDVIDALGLRAKKRVWVDPVDLEAARLFTVEKARALAALPIGFAGERVLVAFANPLDTAALEEAQKIIGRPVAPVVSTRSQIDEAITRRIGRKALGMYLVEAGTISKKQLKKAMELHQKDGVRIGQALVSLGYITQDKLMGFIADQHHLPFYDLSSVQVEESVVRLVPQEMERERRVAPVGKDGETLTLAMVDPLDEPTVKQIEQLTSLTVAPVLTTEDALEEILEGVYRGEYLNRSVGELVSRYPDESAYKVLSGAQKVFGIAMAVLFAVLATLNHIAFFIAINCAATFFYVGSSVYKLYLILRSLSHSLEIPTTVEEVAALDDRDLPVYTVLVPLYREASVLPRLVKGMAELDYPKTKLDVKLLLEEDDKETIAAARASNLPAHFKLVIIPDAQPKGKPKACNYGLIHAEGKYTVIYDAEDVAEPDQLKKAIVAFEKASDHVVCIQAKLNYYNRNQNLLTRWFTSEYAQWFDLLLPGLDATDAPIPLGGTSNHFRTSALRQIGGWDPYNVTEDADLGMRLYKAGYKTGVIDSTTFEEANSRLYNWIRQRSRWVKGYVQTYLVQMRHPLRLRRAIGTRAFLSFNLVIGGTFISFFLNPIYWALTALWFLTSWSLIKEIYPNYLFYIGSASLYIGNFIFVYLNAAGCLKRGYYDLVKYALLVPIYWAIMSIGAWKGFIQLITRPYYWEKTVHGLYVGEMDTATATTLRDLVIGREAAGPKT